MVTNLGVLVGKGQTGRVTGGNGGRSYVSSILSAEMHILMRLDQPYVRLSSITNNSIQLVLGRDDTSCNACGLPCNYNVGHTYITWPSLLYHG